ncbi:hypothetical protein NIES4075_02960 [Tolypothrix sp. NIES-4075]|nr:hypothetical protein NIES4075_02960 [Tolypothrix sp. NIES-4075]
MLDYSDSHSGEVQNYMASCRGTAVPCPYGCTSLNRETLYKHSSGLFESWVHRHQFEPENGKTKLTDA